MSTYPPYPPPPADATQPAFSPLPEQEPPKKHHKWPWIGGGVLVVLLAAGIVGGTATQSRPIAAAAKTVVVTSVVTLPAPAPRTVTVQASPVTKIVTKVVTVAPKPTVPPGPPTSIDADGVYVVGSDIARGTWHTTGGSQCYYARLGSTDTEDILDNNNISGPATVTIGSSTKAFEISGGCTWSKLG
jgi:hypothetical protein